jgi:hypothetical protein
VADGALGALVVEDQIVAAQGGVLARASDLVAPAIWPVQVEEIGSAAGTDIDSVGQPSRLPNSSMGKHYERGHQGGHHGIRHGSVHLLSLDIVVEIPGRSGWMRAVVRAGSVPTDVLIRKPIESLIVGVGARDALGVESGGVCFPFSNGCGPLCP